MEDVSLKDKTVKGVGWSAIDNVTQMGVTFVVSIILARLLSPDDYGLIGIIAIFTAVCNTLINAGFTTALIRKKEVTDDDYNTSFIVNMGLSIALYIIVFLCAPLISQFFEREELAILTRVSSLGMIIGALAIVQQTRLTKRIDFKSQTKITIVASIISGLVGIVMAFFGFGVWSLVAQQLVSQSLRTVMLWLVNKWIPRLKFSSKSFHELFGFGWKMMISSMLYTIWKELYQVVVGKFYSPATLGQYTRSKHFSQMLTSNLTNVIQRVTFPVLSDIQDDKTRMLSAYRRIIKITMFVSTISCFFLAAVAEPLIYCLIGPKWHEAAVYLPPICFIGVLYPLHAINLNMLQVQGRSDLYLGLEIVKRIMALLPLIVGALVGIMPMLYVDIVLGVVSYFLNSHYSGTFIDYSSWNQIKDIAPSFLLATLVAISVYFLKFIPVSCWIVFPLQMVIGTSVLLLLCYLSKNKEFREILLIMEPYIKKIR